MTVREALCQAGASLLLRVKRASALRAWGLKIAKRSSMMCAITAVARKLASILHRMWIDGAEFKPGLGAKVTSAMKFKPPPSTGPLTKRGQAAKAHRLGRLAERFL